MEDTTRAQLVHIARRHYIDGRTKVELAAELGLSRFKIARMLDKALETGVVTIHIDNAGYVDLDLSGDLKRHLGLAECVVVQDQGTVFDRRAGVGAAAGRLLNRLLSPGDVLGLAWGRTVTAMTERLTSLPRVTVVQLTGAVGSDLAQSPVEAVRRASLHSGGDTHPLFAPLLFEDAATAAALRREPEIAKAMSLFDRIDVAVVAIGSWNPPISQLRDLLPIQERERLAARGVQAEVAGVLVLADGSLLSEFAQRCLSISATQLGRIPNVLAVAAEEEKAAAIHVVARSGLITALVTEQACAQALLAMPPVVPRRQGGGHL